MANLFDRLSDQCDELADSLADARLAETEGHIRPATLSSIVRHTLLQLHSTIESFVEDHFMSCLEGSSGILHERLLNVSTREEVELLLYPETRRGADYLAWLPMDVTLSRAIRYFRHGEPFTRLKYRPALMEPMGEITIVRNAIAHTSGTAAGKFGTLLKQRKYPNLELSDFLLTPKAGLSELENYLAVAKLAARVLFEPREIDVMAYAPPEREFDSTEQGLPPGVYTCVNSDCGAAQTVQGDAALKPCICRRTPGSACPACGRSTPCETCSKPRRTPSRFTRVPLPRS